MDVEFALFGIAVGSASFAATYVLADGSPRPRGQPAKGGVFEMLADTITRTALVRRLRASTEREFKRAQVLRQLPSMLDVVTLGLSAGLSFDSSLELYCERYQTELSSALTEAMLSWRIGVLSREEALNGLAAGLNVSALRRFADAVNQALAFGSPLSEALEQQAQTIREEQRAELEAEIERVPVKMLIPLGTLIVPAMLLSILGPLLGASLAIA